MLQEMGVTIWGPLEAVTAAPVLPGNLAAERAAPRPPAAAPTPAAPATVRPAAPVAARSAAPAPATATATAASASPAAASTTPALKLHPAVALYPGADPAQTPAGLGAGWLIVTESLTPADPLGGDAGRLLDNMLRAMQLHRHPRVYLAALERAAPGVEAHGGDITAALADTVAAIAPAMVLVLGHVAARAALGRTEPLGRLRAERDQMAGCPAVVTYDPPFLLRSQDNKAAAWTDLCRALATVRAAG